MKITRRQIVVGSLAGLGLVQTSQVLAQSQYPTKPVRVIVPWVAGVPSDVATRTVVERMAEDLKQPFVVDNRTGATGTVAIPEFLRQPADGYTIFSLNSATLLGPVLYPNANIDFMRDFVPIGSIDTSASVLVTSASHPSIKSMADLVDAAKKQPDGITYASAGNGSPPHVVAEQFNQKTGVKLKHIPYAQVSQLVVDLVSGRVDVAFLGAPLSIPQVKGERLRALAINTVARSSHLPTVATFQELGIQGMDIRAFDGLLVRRGTPQDVIDRLSDSLQKALRNPAVQDTLQKAGLELLVMKGPEFSAHMQAESQRLTTLARQIGVRPAE